MSCDSWPALAIQREMHPANLHRLGILCPNLCFDLISDKQVIITYWVHASNHFLEAIVDTESRLSKWQLDEAGLYLEPESQIQEEESIFWESS